MSSSIRSLTFAAALCLVCSLLLTVAFSGLKPFQLRNMAVDRHKTILQAVGLISTEKAYSPGEIETMYSEQMVNLWVDPEGCLVKTPKSGEQFLPIFARTVKDRIDAYVIPINTQGLWGKIHGYLALDTDGATVRGFTVYKHSETPGLGGEIERRWFQKNFEGKKIVNVSGGFVSVRIAKGKMDDQLAAGARRNMVDGISGATLTGKFLTEGLRDTLRDYEPVSVRFRKDQICRE